MVGLTTKIHHFNSSSDRRSQNGRAQKLITFFTLLYFSFLTTPSLKSDLICREGIVVYKRTSPSSNLKAPKQYVSRMLLFEVDYTSELVLKTPNQPTRCHFRGIDNKPIKWSSFYVGWLRGTLVCNDSLSLFRTRKYY